MTDPIAYGPTGIPCGCGKDAHSNLVPCQPDGGEQPAAVTTHGSPDPTPGDLLRVEQTSDHRNGCHWTDCSLDEGHDGPHDDEQPAVPRTERSYWQAITDALNAALDAGMPVGIDLDGSLTDHNAWAVVWDALGKRWQLTGYDGDICGDVNDDEVCENDPGHDGDHQNQHATVSWPAA